VSDIINNLKNENSGYTYLNTLGKFMQDNDIDPRSFTQIIRLEKKIKLLGISDKLVDDFFDQLDEHTFKHGLDLPSFLKDVANLLALVNRFGMSLSDDWNLVQNLDYRIVT
jgi:hypothetical protein